MEAIGERRVRPENRWGILILLALGLMISFVDRSSMSTAIADHHFVQEFALTHVARGWLGSAVFWSYGVLQCKRDAKAVIDFYDVDTLVPAASSL